MSQLSTVTGFEQVKDVVVLLCTFLLPLLYMFCLVKMPIADNSIFTRQITDYQFFWRITRFSDMVIRRITTFVLLICTLLTHVIATSIVALNR